MNGEYVQRMHTYQDVLENWAFFKEGLSRLNDIGTSRNRDVSPETLLRVLMDCVIEKQDSALVYIVRSKNGKPLSYIIGFDNTNPYHNDKTFLVYAIYSNRKSKTASRVAFNAVEKWARNEGYNEIQAFSPRTSGAFFRLVRRFFGMDLEMTFFSKKL